MTKSEFVGAFQRLCEGHRVQATQAQTEAFFERLSWVQAQDFQVAVTDCLCALKFPSLDALRVACDKATEQRRRARVAQECQQADHRLRGAVGRYDSPEESAYAIFRIGLLSRSIGNGPRDLARIHADGLAAWLDDDAKSRWARATTQGPCGFHRQTHKTHTLLRCLSGELAYWMARASGKTEAEAREAIPGVDT